MSSTRTADFVSHLESLGILFEADGGRLRVNAPKGTLTPELTAELKARKEEVLAHLERSGGALAPPPLEPRERGDRAPLSFAQQRLWFLHQMEPDSPLYTLTAAARLRGPLDEPALERAVGEIVRRHETLRTWFDSTDGRPEQVIADVVEVELRRVDLSGRLDGEREDELGRLAREEAGRPIDIGEPPLWRLLLVRLGEDHHVLLFNIHHIVSDDWSGGVLVGELSQLYGAYVRGEPSPLPELPVQYADFSLWQREWLTGPVLERQLAYWRDRLGDGDLPVLDLPTDRPRPAIQGYRGDTLAVELPRDLAAPLEELCRRTRATPYMGLMAAFQALLRRITGQPDFGVGMPISNRTPLEIESLIGFFVNTLVMRADLAGDPTFRELLARVRDEALGAYDHQDLPFEKLVEELRPDRDLSHSPLFQVMLVLETGSSRSAEMAGLKVERVGDIHPGITKVDLSLYLERDDDAGAYEGYIEYATDLFDRSTVERFAGWFRTLLESAVAEPDRPLSELALTPAAERRRVVVEFNDTAADYRTGVTLHELIAEQAGRTPDLPAVRFEGDSLSYDELLRRAWRLGRHLRRLGVGPEVSVGIYLDRSLELMVGLLGTLCAGGAYVPLDPTYPADRLEYMVASSGTPVILTQSALADRVPGDAARVVVLDATDDPLAQEDDAPLEGGAGPGNLAYTIYTSGSTGRPKGVMNEHRGIVNRLIWMQETYGLGPDDRVLQKTPSSFDVSVWEFFWPLMTGATLVMARPGGHKDPAYLVRTIVDEGITTMHFVPSMLRIFLEADGVEDCTGLRRVICSGEALPHESQERFFERLEEAELHNLYGPTEAAVDVTWWRCRRDGDLPVVPIGRPIANSRCYILDRHLRPTPHGVAGELHLGGVQVARGYRGRPDLTAERFVPDPFGPAGGRLYKTGDLCRFMEDGDIEFLGRNDHQVKVRGFRIELGEIEAALDRHQEVRQAVVVARPGPGGENQLVAYLAVGTAAPNVSELRRFLMETLPEYMVPAQFVAMDDLPLLPNGKVDRKRLPEPEIDRPELEAAYVAPRGSLEAKLAEIWCRVLRLDRIGVHDNFFEVGGDSILSIQVVSRANEAGIPLTPLLVFQHQTVAELAAAAGTAAASRAEQGAVTGEVALTPIQRWFLGLDVDAPHHFNQSVLLRIDGNLKAAHLQVAWRHLLHHHDALRLQLRPTGLGEWQAEIAPPLEDAQLVEIDLSDLAPPRRPAAMAQAIDRLHASFDLARAPLAACALIDLGPDAGRRILLVIHHLAVDGVSWRVLLEDLATACRQARAGHELDLGLKTTSFKAWAAQLATAASSPQIEAELELWSEIVGHETAALPRDRDSGPLVQASLDVVSSRLEPESTRVLLEELPRRFRTRINDALLCALARSVRRWTGGGEFKVDLEGHGREPLDDDADLSRTVGWFTSLYPVIVAAGEGDAVEALQAVKRRLRAVPSGGLGFGMLRYLHPNADLRDQLAAGRPAEVLFNYWGVLDGLLTDDSPFTLAEEPSGTARAPRNRPSHLLEINCAVVEGRMEVRISFSRNRHHRRTMEELGRWFIEELRQLTSLASTTTGRELDAEDFPLADLDADEMARLSALLSSSSDD